MSYEPKTYRKNGGDTQVVASGGKIEVESGGEVELKSGSTLTAALDGSIAKVVADVNVIGGLTVLHQFNLANAATGSTNITLTHKTQVIDAWVVKTAAGAGNAGASTVQVLSTGDAITDAMVIRNVADQAIVRAGTINDANHAIAAGGVLRVTRTKAEAGDNNACIVYVLGIRVA